MDILKVKLSLNFVNDDIAVFNCEKKVSGILHILSSGETTVILDGGYVLDTFDCPQCALEAIGLLALKVRDGEKDGYGNYRQHKRTFVETAYITVH
ncbi:DNA breaking-rejoining protein [Klebsiella aerogenes]